MPKLKFVHQCKEFQVPSGTDLLDAAQKNPSLPLKFGCKKGECGVCAIEVVSGMDKLTKQSSSERATLKIKGLGENYRLACQCAMNGDVEVNNAS